MFDEGMDALDDKAKALLEDNGWRAKARYFFVVARVEVGHASEEPRPPPPGARTRVLYHLQSIAERPRAREEGGAPVARQRVRAALEGLLLLAHLARRHQVRRGSHQPERVRFMGRLPFVRTRRVVSARCSLDEGVPGRRRRAAARRGCDQGSCRGRSGCPAVAEPGGRGDDRRDHRRDGHQQGAYPLGRKSSQGAAGAL